MSTETFEGKLKKRGIVLDKFIGKLILLLSLFFFMHVKKLKVSTVSADSRHHFLVKSLNRTDTECLSKATQNSKLTFDIFSNKKN